MDFRTHSLVLSVYLYVCTYVCTYVGDVFLYIDPAKVSASPPAQRHFSDLGLHLRPYELFLRDVQRLSRDMMLVLDPSSTSYAVYRYVGTTIIAG